MWPKIEVANCSQRRMERPDESRPPRYRYSLRLAMMAAPEKHPKAIAVPTNAVARILVDEQSKSSLTRQTTSTLSISSRDDHSFGVNSSKLATLDGKLRNEQNNHVIQQ